MRSKPIVSIFYLIAFLFVSSHSLSAQISNAIAAPQILSVDMNGVKMRVPLDLPGNRTGINLCNLVPGSLYTVIIKGRMQGQTTGLTLQLVNAGVTQQLQYPNAVRFTATEACASLQVVADEVQDLPSIPVYLSAKCESCPEANAWTKNLLNATGAATLAVQGGQTAETLIKETLVDGECFDVENVTYAGVQSQIGTFSNGSNNIGFSNGVIIATGNINVAPGPNDDDNASAGFGLLTFDPDLYNIANDDMYDRAGIEFDFTPTASPVSFQFVFASEEYCEYVFSQFNDVFGFFISGPGISGTQNLAVVPSTNTPVTINTINHEVNDNYYVNNQPLFSFDLCGQFPSFDPATNEVQYDGFTTSLNAVANVIPCATYHIKLKIADVGDGIFDSAVFLKAGSFDGGGDATVDFVVNGNADMEEANEGCDDVVLLIDRVGSNQSQPVTVSFAIGGTAMSGADFSPIDTAFVIPAGQDQLSIPLNIVQDLIPEGAETIVLTLNNSCSCDVTQKTLSILDYAPLSDTTINIGICNSGDGVTLNANPLGGTAPFSYHWSNLATTASIFVNPTATTTYSVTIVDACSDTATNIFLVEVQALAEINQNVSFCPGGSYTIGDSVYTQTTVVVDTLLGQGGDCDTVLTYHLTLLPLQTISDTLVFCFGDAVTIGDSVYTQSGTVIDTLAGQNGACDTILQYVLEVLPLNSLIDTIAFCAGDSVLIGGVAYNSPGTVTDTIPGPPGACDIIATYTLILLPQISLSDTIGFCPGGSVTIGDSTYFAPTQVSAVLPGSNGFCDTLVQFVLELKPQVTFTQSIAFCPGESVVIGGNTYTQAGTVVDTLPGSGSACDTIATYLIKVLPQVVIHDTIAFCPGDTVVIHGTAYSGFGVVHDTLPGSAGVCDTLATYVLVSLTPAPSVVSIQCPADITVTTEPAVATYNLPAASSDCNCPGIALQLTDGLPSGSVFPAGTTEVCYTAKDSCGNSASCCFKVNVPDEEPCEEATIGCIKYSLLNITEDDQGNNTYRIRVTNNCTTKLMYAAFSLPSGVTALSPANNSIYTAPSGREYSVRNPNYSPFYSIRFRADIPVIANGESDVFEFTLPAVSNPPNIHGVVRVQPKIFYETYLNASDCPVESDSKPEAPTGWPVGGKHSNAEPGQLTVFPNPSAGVIYADLSDWQGETVQIRVLDSRGLLIQRESLMADPAPQEIQLSQTLPNGLYFLESQRPNGEKQVTRFVIQR